LTPVRRIVVVVFLSAWLVGVAPEPAEAHICPVTAQLAVGTSGSATVAVVVEAVPIPDVEIQVPAQLRLEHVDPPAGWSVEQTGQTARLSGPAISAFDCGYFTIAVTPATRGVFGIRVLQRDAKGVLRGDSMPNPALPPDPTFVTTIYAGVKPPGAATGGGVSFVTVAGIALIALGGVAAGMLVWRSRRERRIDERVEAFKKQVNDRGP
jgi:hypothetical protein